MNKAPLVVATKSFPILSLLGAALIVLKLLGKISISWLWVLAPFWGPWAILAGILLAIGLSALATFAAVCVATLFGKR